MGQYGRPLSILGHVAPSERGTTGNPGWAPQERGRWRAHTALPFLPRPSSVDCRQAKRMQVFAAMATYGYVPAIALRLPYWDLQCPRNSWMATTYRTSQILILNKVGVLGGRLHEIG